MIIKRVAVGLFTTALSMNKSVLGVASINAVGVAGQGSRDNSKDKDIPCDMSLELRYYKKKEYDRLTPHCKNTTRHQIQCKMLARPKLCHRPKFFTLFDAQTMILSLIL